MVLMHGGGQKVVINGVDISNYVRSFTIQAEVNSVMKVQLELFLPQDAVFNMTGLYIGQPQAPATTANSTADSSARAIVVRP